MLQLSKKTDYGILILCHLAQNRERLYSAAELSQTFQLSAPFLSNILKELCQVGWIQSTRGAQGGYQFAADARFISVANIITHLEQPVQFVSCAGSQEQESNCAVDHNTCPIRHPLHSLHNRVVELFEQTTLESIINNSVPATQAAAFEKLQERI